ALPILIDLRCRLVHVPAIRHLSAAADAKVAQPQIGRTELEGDDPLPGDRRRIDLRPVVAGDQAIAPVRRGERERPQLFPVPGNEIGQDVGENRASNFLRLNLGRFWRRSRTIRSAAGAEGDNENSHYDSAKMHCPSSNAVAFAVRFGGALYATS